MKRVVETVIRSDRTYTIFWERVNNPEEGMQCCSKLTAKVAYARLMEAIKNSGPIVVHRIEPERK